MREIDLIPIGDIYRGVPPQWAANRRPRSIPGSSRVEIFWLDFLKFPQGHKVRKAAIVLQWLSCFSNLKTFNK